MTMERLFVSRSIFQAERCGDEIIVTEDRKGRYKAISAIDVVNALTGKPHSLVEVRMGTKWYPLTLNLGQRHKSVRRPFFGFGGKRIR